jgi:hypothetical protein
MLLIADQLILLQTTQVLNSVLPASAFPSLTAATAVLRSRPPADMNGSELAALKGCNVCCSGVRISFA